MLVPTVEETIGIETKVTSEFTQTLVTRLTSLSSQKKSSQTQTDIFTDAFMQTECTLFSKTTEIINQRDYFDSVEINCDNLSTVKVPALCFNDNLLCYNEPPTKISLTFNDHQSSIRPSTQINNTIETNTKETQTVSVTFKESSMQTSNCKIDNDTLDASFEQLVLNPCNCDPKMKMLVKHSENSSQTEDVSDFSCNQSEDNNELCFYKLKSDFKTIRDKVFNTNMLVDTACMSKAQVLANEKCKSFSKSLPINLDSLSCTSEGSSQTDFRFQEILRPIHLYGSILRTVYPSALSTLLTPLGNLLIIIM